MIPVVEQLEARDCPSTVYPAPPPGKAVLTVQDIINAYPMIQGHGLFRPTPLMPVAPWAAANVCTYFNEPLDFQQLPNVSEPGEGKYCFVDRSRWQALQDALYGVGQVIPDQWAGWVADQQAAVKASNVAVPEPIPPPLVDAWTHDLAVALVQMGKH